MPTIISPYITDAGLAAAINANANGVQLAITHMVLSTDHFTPGPTSVMASRKEKATISGAYAVGAGFHVSAYFPAWTATPYAASAIYFFVGDPDAGGTLFATYSHPTDSFVQRNTLDYVTQFAMSLARVPTGSVTVAVDPFGAMSLALMAQHEGKANPHAQYISKFATGVALPSADIGVIWHEDYKSLMEWRNFTANGAAYAGYASVGVGRLIKDSQATARPGHVKIASASLSKTGLCTQLWNWALHHGLAVPLSSWSAGMNAYADNGNGTFRNPDLRSLFDRLLDDGLGVDASRDIKAAQAGQTPAHSHANGVTVYPNGDGYGPFGAYDTGIGTTFHGGNGGNTSITGLTSTVGGTTNSSENRPSNFAQLGTIKI